MMLFFRGLTEEGELCPPPKAQTVILTAIELENLLESDPDAKIEINFSEFSTKPKANP